MFFKRLKAKQPKCWLDGSLNFFHIFNTKCNVEHDLVFRGECVPHGTNAHALNTELVMQHLQFHWLCLHFCRSLEKVPRVHTLFSWCAMRGNWKGAGLVRLVTFHILRNWSQLDNFVSGGHTCTYTSLDPPWWQAKSSPGNFVVEDMLKRWHMYVWIPFDQLHNYIDTCILHMDLYYVWKIEQ